MTHAQGLDELATQLFAGAEGAERLAPLLRRWTDDVGDLATDDPRTQPLVIPRLDWAAVEATCPTDPHRRSWCALAANGEVREVDAKLAVTCLRTHVGLFEAWPAHRCVWLRDRISGLCARLLEPVALTRAAKGPAALWEVRVCVEDGIAVLCRPAIDYPLQLVSSLPDAPVPGVDRDALWARLRRGRLRHARTPKLELRLAFRDVLEAC